MRPNRRLWEKARQAALLRDAYRCQCKGCEGCGDGCGRAGILQVDHRVPLNDGGEMYDLGNLQALCADGRVGCHFWKTKGENQTPVDPDLSLWTAYLKERMKE